MRAYLWVAFILHCVGLWIYLSDISTKEYPYTKTIRQGEDIIKAFIDMIFIFWTGIILFL